MEKIVIAHRGASGYLPEHTLESKALAYMMGADYLEQDLAMSQDNHLIVIHDIYLDRLTDVAEKFPEKVRDDGRFYVIDFTLEEIKSLNFSEGFIIENGKKVQEYKNRFPMFSSTFKLHTFEEEIEFIQGLNKTMGKNVGIYVETKAPWFHKQHNKDISKAALEVLKKYGYTKKEHKVFFQTFDFPDLKYVHESLFPKYNMDIKTILLYAYNSWQETYEYKNNSWQLFDYEPLMTNEGMQEVAKYAAGTGPSYDMVIDKEKSTLGNIIVTDFVKNSHKNNMVCHPYTVRKDKLPFYAANIDELFYALYYKAEVDGLFTDFTDLAVKFLEKYGQI